MFGGYIMLNKINNFTSHHSIMGAEPSEPPPAICVPYEAASNADESPVYINNTRIREVGGRYIYHYSFRPDVHTTCETLDSTVVIYGEHKAFGERVVNPDGSFGAYKWVNYIEFQKYAKALGCGLKRLGIQPGDKVGIYSINCTWWQFAQFAIHYIGAIAVPVYDSLGPNSASYIINHAEIKAICVHKKNIDSILKIISNETPIEHVLEMTTEVVGDDPRITTMEKVLKSGLQDVESFIPYPATEDTTAMIMYTSGSTGNPKGCVLSHINIMAGGNGLGGNGTSVTHTDTFFSFLPLAHIYELASQMTLICQGAAIGFYSGEIKNMMADIAALKPTIICGVPRVFNRMAEAMNAKIDKLPSLLKTAVKASLKMKQKSLLNGSPHSLLLDALILKDFRAALGGRIRLIVSGGAPILPEVYELIRAAVTPNIIQGYGLTEITAAACVQQRRATKNPLTVGPVAVTTDLKFRRVPGMQYDPQGNPPSGEILLRGPTLFHGYYKDEEQTKAAMVDGWFATGDVGILLPEGQVLIIDRVKQLVKLSQGEYLSLTSLTDTYSTAKGVQFIYIYADSLHNKPVAVVIPDPQQFEDWKNKGITDPINSDIAKQEIISNLKIVADNAHLRGFERIDTILLDDEEFTIDNGMLTPSSKPKISAMRSKYEARLIELYATNPALCG